MGLLDLFGADEIDEQKGVKKAHSPQEIQTIVNAKKKGKAAFKAMISTELEQQFHNWILFVASTVIIGICIAFVTFLSIGQLYQLTPPALASILITTAYTACTYGLPYFRKLWGIIATFVILPIMFLQHQLTPYLDWQSFLGEASMYSMRLFIVAAAVYALPTTRKSVILTSFIIPAIGFLYSWWLLNFDMRAAGYVALGTFMVFMLVSPVFILVLIGRALYEINMWSKTSKI